VDHSHTIEEWDFETPGSSDRNRILLEQISREFGEAAKLRVFELGCADGVFTQQLAQRFASVIAVDISSVGLERARKRCAGMANIEFVKFDIQRDAMPKGDGNKFDIVLAMDVLEFVRGRDHLTSAMDKLLATLRPGGLFILTACVAIPEIREAWWQAWLPEGGEAHVSLFTERKDLTRIYAELHPKDEVGLPGYPVHQLGVWRKK